MTFYLHLAVAFAAALIVSRITLYWMARQKRRTSVVEAEDLRNVMDTVMRAHLDRYKVLLAENTQKSSEDTKEILRQRDAEYLQKFEEVQRRLQGVAEQAGVKVIN